MLGFIVSFCPWIGGIWMMFEALFGSFGGEKITTKSGVRKKIIVYAIGSIVTDTSIFGIPVSTFGKMVFRRQLINELQGKKGITDILKKGVVKSVLNKTPVGRILNVGGKIANVVKGNKEQEEPSEQKKSTLNEKINERSFDIKDSPEQIEKLMSELSNSKDLTTRMALRERMYRNRNNAIIPSKKPSSNMSDENQEEQSNQSIKERPFDIQNSPEQRGQLMQELKKTNSLPARMALQKLQHEATTRKGLEEKIGKVTSDKLRRQMPDMYKKMEEKLIKNLPINIPDVKGPVRLPANKLQITHSQIVKQLNQNNGRSQ